ncbi:DUF4870 domain-containing protein [Bacillus sp. JZ8]
MNVRKKEKVMVQLMLGTSLILGFIPPLIMFLASRKKKIFYRETSRKALNFHLTIFPLFLVSYILPSSFKSFSYIILIIESFFILNAMISILIHKPYKYWVLPYLKERR